MTINFTEEKNQYSVLDKRDYPILFDSQMVQAILSGKKSQTRRPFKSPLSKAMEPAFEILHDGAEWIARLKNGKCYKYQIICPYGKPGDLLWVKETYAPAINDYAYKADYSKDVLSERRNHGLWKPSIHMPKSAARIWLQITDIKAQRLQSVNENEAEQEGSDMEQIFGFNSSGEPSFNQGFFAKWIQIYGIQSYHINPWVWAITFHTMPASKNAQL